jgi:uncharacterized OB-fold protein
MPSPRYWREVPSRMRLEGSKCVSCGTVAYPIRALCPSCRSDRLETTALTRKGRVVTSTVIHVAPSEFAMESPYAMAIIETPEKARLMVQVVDCDPATVKPGTPVSLEFRRIRREGHSGILCYGYKAVPEA